MTSQRQRNQMSCTRDSSSKIMNIKESIIKQNFNNTIQVKENNNPKFHIFNCIFYVFKLKTTSITIFPTKFER